MSFTSVSSYFPALSSKAYRAYFLGQVISISGTWMQSVALGWMVWQATQSAWSVGWMAGCITLPNLFVTLPAGVLVDRFSKRKLLLLTQTAAMCFAFILVGISVFSSFSLLWWSVVALSIGCIQSIDATIRQAFVSELVPAAHLPSAIALNSGLFNIARIIGPACAGAVIHLWGIPYAFLINGISFWAMLVALFYMKPFLIPLHHPPTTLSIQSMWNGLQYSWNHPIIRALLSIAALVSFAGWSFLSMLPVVNARYLQGHADGLGYLYTACGVGALSAALLQNFMASRWNPFYITGCGSVLFAASLILFSFMDHDWVLYVYLFGCGFGLLLQSSTVNITVQRIVDPAYRGRVMSAYVFLFLGLHPLGTNTIGWLSDLWSLAAAYRLQALWVGGIGILLTWKYHSKVSNGATPVTSTP
ncbi:MAG: MFS transporter [Cytophagaceae bacterium]|nr:MFS transporter [Cytophagaceae bacterium]